MKAPPAFKPAFTLAVDAAETANAARLGGKHLK